MNARKLLIGVALVFGVTETIDIPHTGAPAAVFAVLFFACGAWLRRRGSLVATAILAVQLLMEISTAHSWKGVSMPEKVYAMVLGAIGLAAVAGVLLGRIRRGRLEAGTP